MKYERVVHYVASQIWSILPGKMEELLAALAHRAAGHTFSAEEIRARIGDSAEQPRQTKTAAVAVIPLRGVIAHRMGSMEESSGGMSAERFTAMVKQAAADDSISTILLDVDSPGGSIPGLVEAADAVFSARETKRVVAIANSTMASAAYWIASQAHEIVAIPSAMDRSIGSIGVFTVHQDLSSALEREGVKVTVIKAGANKAEGNPFEPLTDELRAEIQANVDAAYGQFVKAVARGRGVSVAEVKANFGQGRAFSASDAKANGLIDRIATMDDTLARLTGRKTAAAGMRAEGEDPALSVSDVVDPMALTAAVVTESLDDETWVDVDRQRAYQFR